MHAGLKSSNLRQQLSDHDAEKRQICSYARQLQLSMVGVPVGFVFEPAQAGAATS